VFKLDTAGTVTTCISRILFLNTAGTLTTLHSFTSNYDSPGAGVIQATDGSFYGTTYSGGASNAGKVFKLDAAGTLTTLHSFSGGDGATPTGLIQARDGSFCGTTSEGGAHPGDSHGGSGVIFRLRKPPV